MSTDTTTKTIDGQPVVAEPVVIPAADEKGDVEARIAQLEADKAKAIEEAANYKLAFLKQKGKKPSEVILPEDETEEERIRRIVREENATKQIAAIDAEKEALLAKAVKENKELKLALQNKGNLPASDTSHNQTIKVPDTQITPEQLAAFKARGWTDKDIERYKVNLAKRAG